MGAPAAACIWLVDSTGWTDQTLASFLPLLGASEMLRYGRFVRHERRRQFLIGRVLLRQVVGAMLGVPAHALEISERSGQAPLLALEGVAAVNAGDGLPALPFFSLSHSGPWVACAVSTNTALGLDIELADPGRDLAALAQQAFSAAEVQALAASPQAPVAAFYRLWSTQEARYKLGECVTPSCISIPHPELSIVLCSAQPLDNAPPIHPTQLLPEAVARQA